MQSLHLSKFVKMHTALQAPSLVPELKLHLATDVMKLWRETEADKAARACGIATLPPPYWAFVWPGGQALARYLLDHPADVRDRSVLDLGAGSGLVGIAAAKAGAACVCGADIDPLALAAFALNAEVNAVYVEPIENCIVGESKRWDVILAGDLFYECAIAERVWPWLWQLSQSGARVFLGDPGRAYFPAGAPAATATYSVPCSLDLEDRTIRETSVYRL